MPLAPIVIQAEQGALGNDFAAADDGQGTQYVTITGTMGGGSPATEARVISFEVEFPAPGPYELLVEVTAASLPPSEDAGTPAERGDAGPPEGFGADAEP